MTGMTQEMDFFPYTCIRVILIFKISLQKYVITTETTILSVPELAPGDPNERLEFCEYYLREWELDNNLHRRMIFTDEAAYSWTRSNTWTIKTRFYGSNT